MHALFRAAALAFVALASAVSANAQSSPVFSKPIRVIVPYPAGDLADVIARLLAPKLKESLGQPIVIDNKPGASGLLGLQMALQGEPDNHTFVMGQMGSMAVAPITNKQPFDVREKFVPVAMTYTNYMLIVGRAGLPAKNLTELIAYSKANPGHLTLAINGEGGFPHLAMELLKERSGLSFTHIPYKGSGQPTTDVVAGIVDLTLAGFSSVYPQVQSGRVVPIAITGKARTSNAPNIPTVGETVPGYEALGWFGLFAPNGTSTAAITAMNEAVNAALKSPEIRQRAEALSLDTSPGTPAQFGAVWQQDYDKWAKLIRSLNLQAK
jgi:tripartite-type tricarboxylate transporter receptor subunit TctC